MQEYFGDSAKNYGQPQDKFFTLFPAFERTIPQAKGKQTLLDLGCGIGDFSEMATKKGYDYTGVDISPDMLQQAQANYPTARFLQGDVSQPLSQLKQKFPIIVTNLLLPSLEKKAQFEGVFQTASSLLEDDGTCVFATAHPSFDGYMQKHFYDREDIETEFTGYFSSGSNYTIRKKNENGSFTYSDHHWTLSDYFAAADKAGLRIVNIDECPLVGEPPATITEKFAARGGPSFLIFVLEKK